jgi:hypothetical protein
MYADFSNLRCSHVPQQSGIDGQRGQAPVRFANRVGGTTRGNLPGFDIALGTEPQFDPRPNCNARSGSARQWRVGGCYRTLTSTATRPGSTPARRPACSRRIRAAAKVRRTRCRSRSNYRNARSRFVAAPEREGEGARRPAAAAQDSEVGSAIVAPQVTVAAPIAAEERARGSCDVGQAEAECYPERVRERPRGQARRRPVLSPRSRCGAIDLRSRSWSHPTCATIPRP